jgi:hypothetical protein
VTDSIVKQPPSRRHNSAISPRTRARFGLENLPPRNQRAQGMPGARCARSLAWMGLTVTPWSPRCAGLVSHRRLRKLLSTSLTPASGCQDHTAWPPASALPVSQHSRVHRIPPRVRDSREPPLLIEAGHNRYSSDLQKQEAEYFSKRGWTNRFTLFLFFRRVICPSC